MTEVNIEMPELDEHLAVVKETLRQFEGNFEIFGNLKGTRGDKCRGEGEDEGHEASVIKPKNEVVNRMENRVFILKTSLWNALK